MCQAQIRFLCFGWYYFVQSISLCDFGVLAFDKIFEDILLKNGITP